MKRKDEISFMAPPALASHRDRLMASVHTFHEPSVQELGGTNLGQYPLMGLKQKLDLAIEGVVKLFL